jgi:hypothetical protein
MGQLINRNIGQNSISVFATRLNQCILDLLFSRLGTMRD